MRVTWRSALRTVAVSAAGLALAALPALASPGNPHNLGSCAACHPVTPRFGVDALRDVKFTTTPDDPGLCTPCHPPVSHLHPPQVAAGSGPVGARLSTYLPAATASNLSGKIVCRTCHYIHASDTGYGLLRGFPGSPDSRHFASAVDFCQECHGENLTPRSAHLGGERSCVFCHGCRPRAEWSFEAAPAFRRRCELCHRGVREDHYAAANPLDARGDCVLCHDPHTSTADTAGLLSKAYLAVAGDSVLIRPHYRESLCFTCHANTDDYELRGAGVNETCDRCHASGKIPPNLHPLRKVPPEITVPEGWPLTGGALTCLTCHEQGHPDQKPRLWLLRGGGYESPRSACRVCHRNADLLASKIHVEINEGKSCELCHRTRPVPGTDSASTVDFLADPSLLCVRCHDESATGGSVHHADMLGREISGAGPASRLPLYRGRVMCATCHNPHQRDPTGHRLREYFEISDFCVGCHRE